MHRHRGIGCGHTLAIFTWHWVAFPFTRHRILLPFFIFDPLSSNEYVYISNPGAESLWRQGLFCARL